MKTNKQNKNVKKWVGGVKTKSNKLKIKYNKKTNKN